MKKRLLGILLVLTLVLASAMPAMAETEKISDNPDVQNAWEKYVELKVALAGDDVDALRAAYTAQEEANGNLEMEDVEVIEAEDEDFFGNLMTASVILQTDELYDAFLADKNALTAKDFVDYYGMEDVAMFKSDIVQFIPDVDTVYAEAQGMMPSEGIIKVYDAYVGLANALEYWSVDESTRDAVAAFDEVADIFNELSEEELETLALLMGVEDGPAAWNAVFSAVVDLNILISMDDVYQAYMNDPTEETAKAFVEYYEAVFPENPDDAMIDGELVRNFFMGIDETYAEAKAFGADTGSAADGIEDIEESSEGETGEAPDTEKEESKEADVETEEVEDVETAPATGDETSLLPLATLAAAGAAMVVLRRKVA